MPQEQAQYSELVDLLAKALEKDPPPLAKDQVYLIMLEPVEQGTRRKQWPHGSEAMEASLLVRRWRPAMLS